MIWTIRNTKLLAGVAAAAFLLVVPVEAGIIYDFESPTYTAGNINGQDGWTAGGTTAIITTVAPDQLLRIGSKSNRVAQPCRSGFRCFDNGVIPYLHN